MSVPMISEYDPSPTDVPTKLIPDLATPEIVKFLILLSINFIGLADGDDADVRVTICFVKGSL